MSLSDEDLKEFILEAQELLDDAEKSLLALDGGSDFQTHYNAIFRAFHSIKGAAGMMDLTALQGHLHQLETILTDRKSDVTLPKPYIDLFLKGADAARDLLAGKNVNFDYSTSTKAAPAPTPTPAPAAKATPTPATPPSKPSSTSSVTRKSGKVLVIDDEPALLELLMEILKDAGFDVVGIQRPEKAIEQLKAFSPDIVLSDIAMPNLTGTKLLEQIRQEHFDLPVVFISGYLSKDLLIGAIPNDIFAVIEKPFTKEKVIEVCQRALNRPRPVQLLSKSIDLLLYKFPELDDFLKSQGNEQVRASLHHEVTQLLDRCRHLKDQIAKKGGAGSSDS